MVINPGSPAESLASLVTLGCNEINLSLMLDSGSVGDMA